MASNLFGIGENELKAGLGFNLDKTKSFGQSLIQFSLQDITNELNQKWS